MRAEKRGRGSARSSKANRKASLPQVQLLYASLGGTIQRKVGFIIGSPPSPRKMSMLFFLPNHFLAIRSFRSWTGFESQSKKALAVWFGRAPELMKSCCRESIFFLLLVSSLLGYIICQEADLLIWLLAEILQ